jgi:hypothetical protein
LVNLSLVEKENLKEPLLTTAAFRLLILQVTPSTLQ